MLSIIHMQVSIEPVLWIGACMQQRIIQRGQLIDHLSVHAAPLLHVPVLQTCSRFNNESSQL
jgi:hypothetical protein